MIKKQTQVSENILTVKTRKWTRYKMHSNKSPGRLHHDVQRQLTISRVVFEAAAEVHETVTVMHRATVVQCRVDTLQLAIASSRMQ